MRVAVLASGGGTNLQALIDRYNDDPASPVRVALVVGSRAGIGALERARRAGIETIVAGPGAPGGPDPDRLLSELEARDVEMVVLAGYLKLVPGPVVERYRGRMLNIHPALLPAFGGPGMYGAGVHAAVLASGARVSGATVHLVDERYDEGAIVAQWPVPVLPGDTVDSLAARVLAVEHVILPAAIEHVAAEMRGAAGRGDGSPHPGPASFQLDPRAAPSAESVRRLL